MAPAGAAVPSTLARPPRALAPGRWRSRRGTSRDRSEGQAPASAASRAAAFNLQGPLGRPRSGTGPGTWRPASPPYVVRAVDRYQDLVWSRSVCDGRGPSWIAAAGHPGSARKGFVQRRGGRSKVAGGWVTTSAAWSWSTAATAIGKRSSASFATWSTRPVSARSRPRLHIFGVLRPSPSRSPSG